MSVLAIATGGRAGTPPSRALLLVALAAVFAAAFLASLGAGAVPIGPLEALTVLAARVGLVGDVDSAQANVLLAIRLPRTVLGALAGAGLGISGALLQGMFRNPLVDPGLIGVSSGAALAAASVLVLGESLLAAMPASASLLVLPLAAFFGGLAAVAAVQRLGRVAGQTSVSVFLLAGVAVNALAGAAVGLLLFIASDAQMRRVTFWNLGSLGGATWSTLAVAGPLLLISIGAAPRLARDLNLLSLGEAEAGHLGLDVESLKRHGVTLAALAVGAGVAVTGVIGFVGLVVPHLVRLLGGPDHRGLIPGSAFLGGAILLFADIFARTVAAPAEIPIGVVTALLGAPFLLWLVRRQQEKRGWQ